MLHNEKILFSILYFKGDTRSPEIYFILFVLIPKDTNQLNKQTSKQKNISWENDVTLGKKIENPKQASNQPNKR